MERGRGGRERVRGRVGREHGVERGHGAERGRWTGGDRGEGCVTHCDENPRDKLISPVIN